MFSADDIVQHTNVGLDTQFTAVELNLTHSCRYYFTVTAYNNIGLHTTSSSDGFIVDMDEPVTGVVYNTGRYRNTAVQSSTTQFELSWQGFLDHHSGIKAYFTALIEDSINKTSIVQYTNCGLKTSVTFSNLTLKHGRKYFGAVKAIDAANHESSLVFSELKLVDVTPPSAFTCTNSSNIYSMSNNTTNSSVRVISVQFEVNSLYKISGSVGNSDQIPYITILVSEKEGRYFPSEVLHDGHVQFNFNTLSDLTSIHNISINVDPSFISLMELTVNKCRPLLTNESDFALTIEQITPNIFKTSLNVADYESSIKRVSYRYVIFLNDVLHKKALAAINEFSLRLSYTSNIP